MEINISENSWHYHVYCWWKAFSGFTKPESFRENLCHYMRVVLIWAPLGWFFHKPILRVFRPWILAAAMSAVVSTILGMALFPSLTMVFWALYFGIWVFLGFCYIIARLMVKYDKATAWTLTIMLLPVWLPIAALFKICSKFWNIVIEPYYIDHEQRVWLWVMTLAILIVGVYFVFGPDFIGMIILIIAMVILVVIAMVALFYFLFAGIPYLVKRARASRQVSTENTQPKTTGISTGGLLKAYREAKWGSRICPFINLPATEM